MRIALSDAAADSKARASTNLKAITEFGRLDGFRIEPQTVMREAFNDFLKTREVPRRSSPGIGNQDAGEKATPFRWAARGALPTRSLGR
jgi:hypothetical protein